MADDSSNSSTSLGDSPAKPTPSDPKPHRPTLRDWLELARISNLPTVWTNVMVGVACGSLVRNERLPALETMAATTHEGDGRLSVVLSIAFALAGSCFYIGGMIFNDWCDRAIDKLERPRRPLPSGRISEGAALRSAMLLFAFGLVALWIMWDMRGLAMGSVLVACIVLYDMAHRWPAAVLLMGACRGLLYAIPAILFASFRGDLVLTDARILIPAAVITAYTACITIVSRSEVTNVLDLRKYLAVLMPVGVLAMVGVLKPAKMEWWIAAAAFAVSLWLARAVKFVFAKPAKTVPAILTWLSGMCLIDAYFLTLLGYPIAALIAGGCFALTAWGHRKILGT